MQADRERASLDAQRTLASAIRAHHRELVGRPFPRVSLQSPDGGIRLDELADAHDLVVYPYPGSERSPTGEDVHRIDEILHRAFRANAKTLLGRGFHVLGISSQQAKAQRRVVAHNRLEHQMLSDPYLLLAKELGLPTFATDHGCWYERVTLVVQGGRIAWVQYPIHEPSLAPAQAIAWIDSHDTSATRAQGNHVSGDADAS